MKTYVNQAGYLPGSKKTVILAQTETDGEETKKIRIMDENGKCILETDALYWGYDKDAGDHVWHADVSAVSEPGEYLAESPAGERSSRFRISEDLYEKTGQVLLKALYYQRCGTALEERCAGVFRRECCHTGKAVRLEDYEKLMSGGTVPLYEVRGGWHDAGDYGRYTTAAAAALAHLLYAYRFFPESFCGELNLPESGNGIPDILNECFYELRWLRKMQMEDGSVCHKLTSMRHANFVMPEQDDRQFILFPPSAMATGDFAAVMALASRVYAAYDSEFAQDALAAAEKAWNWLKSHPEFLGFENPPGCNTGDYGDTDDRDERLWAAAELYLCTGDPEYLKAAERLYAALSSEAETMVSMGWGDVSGFAGWCLLRDNGELAEAYRQAFTAEAERIVDLCGKSGYGAAMETADYGWGSNMVVLNRAMVLGTAYLLTSDQRYLECAGKQMDYILGVNATGFSYITGIGEHAAGHPHNRVTEADGIEETIPGFVVGGPCAVPADEKAEWLIVPGTPPMKCYLDLWECYSLNEITIYWNSPAVFVCAFLNDTGGKKGRIRI